MAKRVGEASQCGFRLLSYAAPARDLLPELVFWMAYHDDE